MMGFRRNAEKMMQMRRDEAPRKSFAEMQQKGADIRALMNRNRPATTMTAAGPNPMPGAMKKGGVVKSASSRADGCAVKGKTKCKTY